MTTQRYTGILTVMTCPIDGCGVVYGLDEDYRLGCEKDSKKGWYCSNGHRLHYPGPSSLQKERDRLANELEATQRRIIRAENARDAAETEAARERRSAAAQKGHATRLRRRAAAGVCPCCNRTFQNLARHVAGQHPDFVEAVKP